MPTITSLEVQKKNKDRVNVFVDGEFFCGLLMEDAVKQHLTVGAEYSESELGAILSMGEENTLYTKVLTYVLNSPKTERQTRTYLYGKTESPETIANIIARLKEYGYINDADYAARFAEVKQTKLGVKSIHNKLLQKGINRETVERITAEVDDQTELCTTTAEKYMRNKPNDMKTNNKLYRYLISKGFEYDTVGSVMENLKRKN
jgi:regulatory protein